MKYHSDHSQCVTEPFRSNRHNQTATHRELRLQRLWNRGAFSGDDNAVVGGMLRPTERAIASMVNNMMVQDHYKANKNGAELHYVKKMRIRISKLSADRLGIKIPSKLQRFKYEYKN